MRVYGRRGVKKDERKEETGMFCRAITRVNLGGGERRGPEPSRTKIYRNLNIGTESRVQIDDALGRNPPP